MTGNRPPVLIYCPGRTATTSLGVTLTDHGVANLVTHNLDWQFWAERNRHALGPQPKPGQLNGIAYELQRMRQAEMALAESRNGRVPPIKIVTAVRFPYNHFFSVIAYMAPHQFDALQRAGLASSTDGGLAVDADGYLALLEEAAARFCRSLATDPEILIRADTGDGYRPPLDPRDEIRNFALFYIQYMQTWLRREFQAVLGIDLLRDRPMASGHGAWIYDTVHAQVLLLKIDEPALDFGGWLGSFLQVDGLEMRRENQSADRHPGFHGLVMSLKERFGYKAALLGHYRADPLLQLLYPDETQP
ncbi:putative capsular polysaccharide synthesis family protein [Marinibaculum pumilum]|uniref:Capsular polysaccharide synthesis family protein n=1 Tax=Marinibaculum pumilum TaxID=1766165 RepID=A0ABV7L4G3_9PROT